MANIDELYLILGCYGRIEDNFICCNGIENAILQVSKELIGYSEMIDFFDICKLFDKPIFEYNVVRNFINQINNKFDQGFKKLFTERQYQLYHKFIIDHKSCGLFIRLSMNPLKSEPLPQPPIISVAATPEPIQSKITLVR